jgi:hypothetical protein
MHITKEDILLLSSKVTCACSRTFLTLPAAISLDYLFLTVLCYVTTTGLYQV